MSVLLDRLGLASGTRAVILTAAGLGLSHATTEGVLGALRLGVATTGTLQVPGPWARHAADRLKGDDVGIELTLNAPYASYRWGPLTSAPSLVDGEGAFPRTVEDTWDHADLDEIRRECLTQLERAKHWGVDPTHLAVYPDAICLRPEFFDVLVELAADAGLPIRLPSTSDERRVTFPLRGLAEAEGVLHPDEVVLVADRAQLLDTLERLGEGVTEVVLRPASDTAELRAYASDWPAQVDAAAALAGDAELRERLGQLHTLGYRELRTRQQALASSAG